MVLPLLSLLAMMPSQAGQGAGDSAGNPLKVFIPILVTIVIFYLLLLRPEQQRQRRHQQMLGQVKKGDQVVTSGGMIGRIVDLSEKTVTLDVGNKVRIEILRSAVREVMNPSSEDQR